ncbi:hypothetical protein K435DRAFT_875932 [Dendrothele bispora CBS 962.96]|uniref:Uncharacterized protein n=1 Tax=Dendrothele bispora (strain CBS 962.96) TaxID=1314807 RepID=A0A4S8KT94_DENBC|nr:hypothetical protein K435DRAFT_875932 [Dendrothele bispora CBS 962.96]
MFVNECQNASQAPAFLNQGFAEYNVSSIGDKTVLLSLMVFESGGFNYNRTKSPPLIVKYIRTAKTLLTEPQDLDSSRKQQYQLSSRCVAVPEDVFRRESDEDADEEVATVRNRNANVPRLSSSSTSSSTPEKQQLHTYKYSASSCHAIIHEKLFETLVDSCTLHSSHCEVRFRKSRFAQVSVQSLSAPTSIRLQRK